MTSTIIRGDLNDQVSVFAHPAGLMAVAAICSTTLGPALCPLGIQNVPIDKAIDIAVKKGHALAAKCALHHIEHGGGCLIILGNPAQPKSDAFYELAAHVCDYYAGDMIAGQDVGVSDNDIARVAALVRDPHTVAHHPDGANHALTTARGVRLGLEAVFNFAGNAGRLEDARILIQGLGNVSAPLSRDLQVAGFSNLHYASRTPVAGLPEDRIVAPENAYDFDGDILSPCISTAGAITVDVVDRLKVGIIAGCANLQFADEDAIWAAHRKGILHAPDPVINGGGIIAVTQHTEEKVAVKLALLQSSLIEIFERSRRTDTPPLLIAQAIARERIEAATKRPRP